MKGEKDMKKLVVALVCGVFVLSLAAGCGQKEEAPAPEQAPAMEETPMTEEAPAMENMTSTGMEAPAEAPAE